MIDVRITKKKSSSASGFNISGGGGGVSAPATDSTELVLSWIRSWLVPVDELGNELERDSEAPIAALKSKYPFYSVGEVSAYGSDGSSGSGSTGTGGVGINASELADYLSNNGYATQTWVNEQGFIKNHQDLSAYLKSADASSTYLKKTDASSTYQTKLTIHTLSAVSNLGWEGTAGYIPTINTLAFWNGQYAEGSSNLQYCDQGRFGSMATKSASDYALASSLSSHVGNSTMHITSDERDNWNGKLDASVFNELFAKETLNGKTVIKAKFSLYSDDELSALGYGGSGSSSGTGGVGINASELADYLSNNGYATQTWVTGKNYATQAWVTDNYQPKGSYLTAITKQMVEGVLTGNISTHSHSQYLTAHQDLSAYLTKTIASSTYLSKTDASSGR